MRTPKVSVCIPNYNNRVFVKAAISSVLNQTMSDLELVIVDDSSTDGSQRVIGDFQDKRIRYYENEKNIGRVKNINKCLSLATGEYVTLLPSDDEYEPTSLERRAALLDSNPKVGLVYSSAKIIDEHGGFITDTRPHHKDYVRSAEVEFKHLIFNNYIVTSTVMVRKKCCDDVGLFNEEFTGCSDWELWLRIILNGFDIGYIAESLALERMHGRNASNFYLRANLAGMSEYRMIKMLFSRLDEKKKHLSYLEPLALRSLGIRLLRQAGVNMTRGNGVLARQNIGLAVAVCDEIAKDWKARALLLSSFFFERLPKKVRNGIYGLGKRWLQ